MSPTVLRKDGYRLYFFSREEPRVHIHAYCSDGEAKFWLEPQVELAYNHHLSRKQLREIEALIDEHFEEIVSAWRDHFGS
jgi:Domain of unknown function (DUF4160)